ncbi:MAG: PEP-CTERM sorting domain-containing protein [Nostoc sp. GBBB01]|nr:PEP-CTERM sorting domain-containing protein [Nostoc sp. GBBB01]
MVSVPESSPILGILVLGTAGITFQIKRQFKH